MFDAHLAASQSLASGGAFDLIQPTIQPDRASAD
jgi:hypothetical protein